MNNIKHFFSFLYEQVDFGQLIWPKICALSLIFLKTVNSMGWLLELNEINVSGVCILFQKIMFT